MSEGPRPVAAFRSRLIGGKVDPSEGLFASARSLQHLLSSYGLLQDAFGYCVWLRESMVDPMKWLASERTRDEQDQQMVPDRYVLDVLLAFMSNSPSRSSFRYPP